MRYISAKQTAETDSGVARGPVRSAPRARFWPLRSQPRRRPLSLALQGGGSFGAFTWGVLDRLLEHGSVALDTVSGTSAGAVNAVVLANGLAAGGPAAAREGLERFWRRVSSVAPFRGIGRMAVAALELAPGGISPYQFNPLGLNPLRDILADEIDFARLRVRSPVRLIIAATCVRDGSLRLFRDREITLEAVLASAALPQLHHPVEIDGEWYWDGGYSANPPLRQLAVDSRAEDIMLVQITPEAQDGVPRLSPHIMRRVRHITFNGPLLRDIEALAELCAFCRQEGILRSRLCRKLQRLRLHHLRAEHAVAGLDQASALDVDWPFLMRLKTSGRDMTGAWLADWSPG